MEWSNGRIGIAFEVVGVVPYEVAVVDSLQSRIG